MNRRKFIIVLTVITIIAIPCFVFAATSDTTTAKTVRGFFGIDTSKLTEQQKSGLTDTYKKMADLQKAHVNKLSADGLMTKEQAAAAVSRIDAMLKSLQENGFSNGLGMFMGGFGHFGVKGANASSLTDQQKADLTDYSNKMAELQKELISKAVSYGLITKEQGDAMAQKVDNIKNFEGNGFPKGMRMPKGRFGNGENQNNTNQNTAAIPTL